MASLAYYNAAAADKFGLKLADFGTSYWGDVKAIAKVQDDLQVTPDGWIGPATAGALLLAKRFQSAGLVIDRKRYRTSFSRRRVDPARPLSIVWHDSITRTAKDCYSVLEKRGLSTHYMIPEDPDEPIYQCADPGSTWCLHAGAFNQESIGVDVISLLDPSLLSVLRTSDRARRIRVTTRPWSASKERPSVVGYTPSQLERAVKLAMVLHEFFDIPKVVPTELTGYGKKVAWVDSATYRGSIAHAQWSTTRWDGLFVIEALSGAGWSGAGPG